MTTKEEKQRRMELRKDTGTRVIEPPKVPPFHRGPEYLIAHACFSCRKSFKCSVKDNDHKHVCPQCSGQLYEMGRSFKAPRTSDIKQWKKVQWLYSEGFRFIGCGSRGGAKLPSELHQVETFLKENPKHPLKVEAPNKALYQRP